VLGSLCSHGALAKIRPLKPPKHIEFKQLICQIKQKLKTGFGAVALTLWHFVREFLSFFSVRFSFYFCITTKIERKWNAIFEK
jgi:hypothetical protein